jgi:hypothetical protein
VKSGPTAAGERRRDRRANAVRAHLIKYGTTQPVRLHNPRIENVRRTEEINGIGNQLQVWQGAIEVSGPGSQSMIIAGHAAAEESVGVLWSAVAIVVGRKCVAGEQ